LGKEVVTLEEIAPGVAQITMADKAGKNTFTQDLIDGLQDCFSRLCEPRYKVAILTGYENYFACGGTKEELISFHRGELTFDQLSFYRIALDCEIPVIAAMQGHAIGGGFVLGLYADMVVLGWENIYTANFMRYGFTPGLGATLIVPARLGEPLGQELLFTGHNYRGEELARRGIPYPVVPKKQVLERAQTMAQSLAEKPRLSLTLLKRHFAGPLRQRLSEFVQHELKMHEATFKQPEVEKRIHALFGN
jgi:polyketide biosynthesis enoyl-CoA hydratase PksI